MTELYQLGIILFILWSGQSIQRAFDLALPGNVLGMIILLVLLVTGIMPLGRVEKISDILLRHLTFFFLPTGVGVMTVAYLLKGNVVSIILILLLSLAVVMITTGLTVQWMVRRKEAKESGKQ